MARLKKESWKQIEGTINKPLADKNDAKYLFKFSSSKLDYSTIEQSQYWLKIC